jgi:BASS family bile acid:Na+ symporter
LSIAIIPLAVHLLALYYGKPFSMGPWAVAKVALTMALVPLAAGMLVRAAMPSVARHLEKPAKLAGGLLLLLGALVILAGSMHAIIALVGSGTLAAFLAFVLAGLAAGHLLGGPGRDDRVVLALSTACRHPGLAIAIAVANAPGDREIVPAVLLYLLVSIVVSIPYVRWGSRQKHLARVDPAAR